MSTRVVSRALKASVVALGVAGSTLAALPALALPPLPSQFSRFYSDKGIDVTGLVSQSCKLCHGGIFPNRSNINDYAQDLRDNTDVRAAAVDFSVIDALDSDNDGASNIAEITAGTLPGDASSKP